LISPGERRDPDCPETATECNDHHDKDVGFEPRSNSDSPTPVGPQDDSGQSLGSTTTRPSPTATAMRLAKRDAPEQEEDVGAQAVQSCSSEQNEEVSSCPSDESSRVKPVKTEPPTKQSPPELQLHTSEPVHHFATTAAATQPPHRNVTEEDSCMQCAPSISGSVPAAQRGQSYAQLLLELAEARRQLAVERAAAAEARELLGVAMQRSAEKQVALDEEVSRREALEATFQAKPSSSPSRPDFQSSAPPATSLRGATTLERRSPRSSGELDSTVTTPLMPGWHPAWPLCANAPPSVPCVAPTTPLMVGSPHQMWVPSGWSGWNQGAEPTGGSWGHPAAPGGAGVGHCGTGRRTLHQEEPPRPREQRGTERGSTTKDRSGKPARAGQEESVEDLSRGQTAERNKDAGGGAIGLADQSGPNRRKAKRDSKRRRGRSAGRAASWPANSAVQEPEPPSGSGAMGKQRQSGLGRSVGKEPARYTPLERTRGCAAAAGSPVMYSLASDAQSVASSHSQALGRSSSESTLHANEPAESGSDRSWEMAAAQTASESLSNEAVQEQTSDSSLHFNGSGSSASSGSWEISAAKPNSEPDISAAGQDAKI